MLCILDESLESTFEINGFMSRNCMNAFTKNAFLNNNFCLIKFQLNFQNVDYMAHTTSQWRTQEKISGGGFKVLAGLVGGPGGGAPRTPENFRKFAKNFFEENGKNALF